jgi:YfiR/HmsC-like
VKKSVTFRLLDLTAGLLLLVAGSGTIRAQEMPDDEYEIRAAIIFNLTKFVDWPGWKAADSSGTFTLCELGTDAVSVDLEKAFRGKTILGKPAILRRIKRTDATRPCHILYVAASERKPFEEMAPTLERDAVLTVGYEDWFTSEGGVVSLPMIDDRIRIQINHSNAQHSGIAISSKLLRIASVVH